MSRLLQVLGTLVLVVFASWFILNRNPLALSIVHRPNAFYPNLKTCSAVDLRWERKAVLEVCQTSGAAVGLWWHDGVNPFKLVSVVAKLGVDPKTVSQYRLCKVTQEAPEGFKVNCFAGSHDPVNGDTGWTASLPPKSPTWLFGITRLKEGRFFVNFPGSARRMWIDSILSEAVGVTWDPSVGQIRQIVFCQTKKAVDYPFELDCDQSMTLSRDLGGKVLFMKEPDPYLPRFFLVVAQLTDESFVFDWAVQDW